MNINQRKRILQNIDSLVELTDFDKLCQACYQSNLLSSAMIQNICLVDPRNISNNVRDEILIKEECHKRLFLKITKRGPDAFEKLRRILAALNCNEALNILFGDNGSTISISSSKKSGEPKYGNGEINYNNDVDGVAFNRQFSDPGTTESRNPILHEFKDLINIKKQFNVRIATRITIDPTIGTYLMESKNNRGIFVIVSSGSKDLNQDEDILMLLSLFKQLGFKLYAYGNLTLNQIFELLKELLTSDKLVGVECFVFAIKAGCRIINGVQCISFNDGSMVKVEQIQKYFHHQNCRELAGRPKIFIYPYSEIPNNGLISSNQIQTDGVNREGGLKHISQLSDVINCYATTKGFMDDRDEENYSRYIQCFVDIIAQHSFDTHFENMLKMIQDRVTKLSISNGYLQTASYDNISFNKLLYFNPGLSID